MDCRFRRPTSVTVATPTQSVGSPSVQPESQGSSASTDHTDADALDVSAAKTDTQVSDTEPVRDGAVGGGTTGDTSGDDPHGADDTR